MPFNHGAFRCGSPLSGADSSLPDQPANLLSLLVVGACGDEGVRRLLLASALFVAGIVMTAIGLWLSSIADARRRDDRMTADPADLPSPPIR
jgi:hypothetical protein